MRLGKINIPDSIFEAQKTGSLVIFAGAGVSVAEPSGLPLFDQLAKRISAGSDLARQSMLVGDQNIEVEPVDRFLGRLANHGVKVHEAAKEILIGEHTKPNNLHHLLVRLFPVGTSIKLVTTNFDTHFSTVLMSSVEVVVPNYQAPALPLGGDFNGLVYLHGCAENPLRCVLTDEDFGRAYLTEGWARRFLVAMFATYTVLFVGYSHNDPVMTYLARGLPPDSRAKRFAFVSEGEEAHWQFLSIQPISYPKSSEANSHAILEDSLEKWAAETARNLISKAQKVKNIAIDGPPLDPEDQDYIDRALSDRILTLEFIKHAESPKWLVWLEKRGALKNLFEPTVKLSEPEKLICDWLASAFLDQHTQALLTLMEGNVFHQLHRRFCRSIWVRLTRRKNRTLPASVFMQWCCVLLSQPSICLEPGEWAQLLSVCVLPETRSIIVPLFDRASNVQLILHNQWDFFEENKPAVATFDLTITHDAHYWLSEAWRSLFLPSLELFVVELEPLLTSKIWHSRRLLEITNPCSPAFDKLSLGRQSIEPHEQDTHSDGINFIVSACRDVMKSLQDTAPDRARELLMCWFRTQVPILRRLAIHAIAGQPNWGADDKISFLISERLLFDSASRVEVFFVLRNVYPLASQTLRNELIDSIFTGLAPDSSPSEDAEYRERVIFELLTWLRKADPSCELAAGAAQEIEQKHPTFTPSPFPGFLSWHTTSESFDLKEGFNREAILMMPPEQFLKSLLDAPANYPFKHSRSSYCQMLMALVRENPEWGLRCQSAARLMQIEESDVWSYFCSGWREAKLTGQLWREVLQEFAELDTPLSFLKCVPTVLKSWAELKDGGLPEELYELAGEIAARAWNETLSVSDPSPPERHDWTFLAINSSGGNYADFLMHHLNVVRKRESDVWRSIPEPYAQRLRDVIRGRGEAAELGRIFIAAQLRWLDIIDASFVEQEVLPLLDWTVNSRTAEQCWHGFLSLGRWPRDLTEKLLPLFEQTVECMPAAAQSKDGHIIERIGEYIAYLSLWVFDDALKNDWLQRVLRKASEAMRNQFSRGVGRQLDQSEAGTAEAIWERWLARYWKLRNQGIPLQLTVREANEMVGWCFSAGKHFPDAVALVREMGVNASFEYTAVTHYLYEKKIAEQYPNAAADLVLMYLETSPPIFGAEEELKSLWNAFKAGKVSQKKLEKIREAVFKLNISVDDFEP